MSASTKELTLFRLVYGPFHLKLVRLAPDCTATLEFKIGDERGRYTIIPPTDDEGMYVQTKKTRLTKLYWEDLPCANTYEEPKQDDSKNGPLRYCT